MKRNIKIIIIFLFIISCNYYLINRALNISRVYPFKRILLGNELHYSSILNDSPLLFRAKILKINNIRIDKKQVIDRLLEISDKLESIELISAEKNFLTK